MLERKKVVPVFFAIDENYLPYLSVSIMSIKENASSENQYKIYVLQSGISEEKFNPILSLQESNFEISFVDVSQKLKSISNGLVLRDYYTLTTYYRIFIAELFPEFDKAVYIDSDTVSLTDIANLYNVDMENNLLAGVPDGAVGQIEPFQRYVNNVLGIDYEKYFNAGIIVMNLKEFRNWDFYGKFNDLLKKYKFNVAQDQDYLNVLCNGKVKFLPESWNVMPILSGEKININPFIVHFNLTSKPWHYSGLQYEEIFWKYAKKSYYYQEILKEKEGFTEENALKDSECEKNLLKMCIEESENPENYFNKYCKKEA